ncbi:MAG TPA: hypothetical protein VIJ39_09125 [Solirubrobacteraceae bacterium]
MTDFLDEKRREINDRLAELKPLIDEYTRLQDAASALAGVGGSAPRAAASTPAAAAAAPARRGPGRPRGSKSRTTTARRGRPPKAAAAAPASEATSTTTAAATPRRRAGRRKGSGTRAAQALSFVTGQPGITIPELAAKMNIKQNYLYRVLPGLEQEKKIKKQGRGWHPAS